MIVPKLIGLLLSLGLSCLLAGDGTRNVWLGVDNDVLPQVADGADWMTAITIVNMDTAAAQYKLEFYKTGGQRWSLDFVGLGNGNTITGTLPVNGSVVIQTAATAQTVSMGFAILTSPNSKDVNGYGIFRQRIPGRSFDFEAVVPFSNKFDDDFVLAFDNTPGYTTSMAICNPSDYAVQTVTVSFYDPLGARFHQDQFQMNPLEHRADAMPDRWPQTAGKKGVAVFQVGGAVVPGAPVLGLRFNSTGPFTSTHALSR
jgi:hypothetical protein